MPPPRAPCPLHSASMSLCSCSRSAPVQPVVAVVVLGVVRLASILSPFPLEAVEERSLLASAPIHPQRACSAPDRPADGGRRKGLRILCVHVCGAPRVRADAEGPRGSQSPNLSGVPSGAQTVLPHLSRSPPCPEPLLETPLAASAQDMSLEDEGIGMALARMCQSFQSTSQSLAPRPPRRSSRCWGGHTPPLAPALSLCPAVSCTSTRIQGKVRVPAGPTELHIPSSPLEIPLDN